MEKIMKILIATDGSEFSETVVKTSCELLKNCENTVVKIVSAFEPPLLVAAAPYAVPVAYNPNLEKRMRDAAEKWVGENERQMLECLPDLKNDLTTQVLRGSPERAIVEEAEKWGADLIIVGSHGYGFWERVFLGSVSNAVVHHAPCSVLVVRKDKKIASSKERI
jgi:nucleotide-binding universal stress UspA family protein